MESSHSGDPPRCLVALKTKVGELDAICNTDDVVVSKVVHLVELLDSTGRDRGRIAPLLDRAAVHLAARGRQIWVDPRWLSADSPLRRLPGGPFAYLNHIEQAVEDEFGLFALDQPWVVPVVGEASTDMDLRQVSILREHKDRDTGLRVTRLASTRFDLEALAERIIRRCGVAPTRIHVIIDAKYVDIATTHLIDDIARLTSDLSEIIRPASITLLTGSIPQQRNGYQTLIRERSEPALWHALRCAGVEGLRYGDYGVVHPKPTITEGRPQNPHPYLNYTISGHTLTLRRPIRKTDDVTDEGAFATAYGEIADELTERREFAGGDFSWGDRSMIECRTGRKRVGSVSKWIAMATSHHIAHLARNVDGIAS